MVRFDSVTNAPKTQHDYNPLTSLTNPWKLAVVMDHTDQNAAYIDIRSETICSIMNYLKKQRNVKTIDDESTSKTIEIELSELETDIISSMSSYETYYYPSDDSSEITVQDLIVRNSKTYTTKPKANVHKIDTSIINHGLFEGL